MPTRRRRRPDGRKPCPPCPPTKVVQVVEQIVVAQTGPRIALVDFGGTGVDPSALGPCAAALAKQVNQQFALPSPIGHGISISGMRVCSPSEVAQDEWVIGLVSHPDVPGALGYHDRTPSGRPFMKVFPLLDAQDGVSWQSTASHELLETLKDPELGQCVQGPSGKIWADEVCDAVESDSYSIDGVPVSNWVTPLWAQSLAPGQPQKYDWMGLCTQPEEIRPGGYAQWWDPQTGWNEVDARKRAYRRNHDGRSARRRARLKR